MKQRGRCLLLLISLAVLPAAAQAQTASGFGRFHAVVIGNQNYKHLPPLRTPLADAEEVANVLKEQYGFTIDPLQDTTRGEIMAVLYNLRYTMTERDNLLIYYAGHGEFDEANQMGYWQPIDAEQKNPDKWISIGDINSQLKAISARHVLVVADSCYSGTLMRNSGFQPLKGKLQDDYLRRMQARPSRTALTSGGKERVADDGGSGHSVFTEVFLTVLRKNQNFLTGTQLFNKINKPVTNHAEQTPYYGEIKSAYSLADHIEDKGDFVFVPKKFQPDDAAEEEQQRPVDLNFLKWGSDDRAATPPPSPPAMGTISVSRQKSPSLSRQNTLQPLEKLRQITAPPKSKTVGQYIDHGNGTVTDTKTGLMWKRCAEGLSGMNCEEGKLEEYKWNDAVQLFKNVGYAGYFDWRMPTIDELKTLVYCSKGVKDKDDRKCNYGSEKPTINQQVFPNTTNSVYRSGSPYLDSSVSTWNVNFGYGSSLALHRFNDYAVRLVRGGQ